MVRKIGREPRARVARLTQMRAHLWLGITFVAAVAMAACQAGVTASPTASPRSSPTVPNLTPSDSAPPVIFPGPTDGPEKLIVDLEAAGAAARIASLFAGDPFDAQGGLMCVGSEPVQLYVFGSVLAREQAVARIDPKNPSNMGTTIVDWNGRPRMWQRDRMVIVYLGEDAPTEALLRSVLGDPFASGAGRPPLPGPKTCG